MGGGILILVIMLIIWAVVTAKENIQASYHKEVTKDMTYEERRHYNYRRVCAEMGYDTPSYEEFKKIQEAHKKEMELQEQREFEEEMKKLKATFKYYKG